MKIAIIDSGISQTHPFFNGVHFSGIHFLRNMDQTEIVTDDNIEDTIGHGTAVAALIMQNVKPVLQPEIFICKVFDSLAEIDEELLLAAMHYLLDTYKVDIINISAGVTRCGNLKEFRWICTQLTKQGTAIVAAYDNNGAISYPAAFEAVIGVDSDNTCKRPNDYIYVENSDVNILTYGLSQRLPWSGTSYKTVMGSSFAAPYITARVANILYEIGQMDDKRIRSHLRNEAVKIITCPKSQYMNNAFVPARALVFPWNKEQENIARYAEKFDIVHVCDARANGNIGKSLEYIVSARGQCLTTIENIEKVNWNDPFDTVILGHTRILSTYTNVDWKRYIIEKCMEYHKNLCCYDDLSRYGELCEALRNKGLKCWFPKCLTEEMLPVFAFNKLYQLTTPVVSVVGTRPKQGKLSTQLLVKKQFEAQGYKVGFLSSEPNGQLLGADYILPFGYDSEMRINQRQFIRLANWMMHDIEEKAGPDIIITGSQSQSVPYSFGNVGFYPLDQYAFQLAVDPDAYILCVSMEDEISYIHRTINFLDSITEAKTVALSLFPYYASSRGSYTREVSQSEIEYKKEALTAEFHLPVYAAVCAPEEVRLLQGEIVHYFEE